MRKLRKFYYSYKYAIQACVFHAFIVVSYTRLQHIQPNALSFVQNMLKLTFFIAKFCCLTLFLISFRINLLCLGIVYSSLILSGRIHIPQGRKQMSSSRDPSNYQKMCDHTHHPYLLLVLVHLLFLLLLHLISIDLSLQSTRAFTTQFCIHYHGS